MIRILRLSRDCSTKLPKQSEDFKQKEEQAMQEIQDEKLEENKNRLNIWFPDPDKQIVRKEVPSYVSQYGQSEEEDTPAFFLEDLKNYQYIYTPKQSLIFDDQGYSLVFQTNYPRFFMPHKLKYCWKLIFPIFFSLGVTFQTTAHTNLSMLLSWVIPFAILSRALMVDKIFIHKDGKHAKFLYKRFKFFGLKEKVLDVSHFKEPAGDAFMIWSLYEFPDDLKTFSENEAVKRIAFAKYLTWWSFFLLPKFPKEVNREVLINMLNGIYIDTEHLGGDDLKSRYLILNEKKPQKSGFFN